MQARVFSPRSGDWVTRGEGIRTLALVTRAIGGRSFLNGITEIAGGKEIPFHSHNCEESVVVLEGIGTMDVDGEISDLLPFDATWIPSGVPHRFVNRQSMPLRILWMYGSADATRTFLSNGLEVRVGDLADAYDLQS